MLKPPIPKATGDGTTLSAMTAPFGPPKHTKLDSKRLLVPVLEWHVL